MSSKRDKTIYIAGPMSGVADWNYPLFHEVTKAWRAADWTVLNPAESFGGRTDLPYARYMRNALKLVMKAGHIALLPGWQNSKGAQMEALVAARQGYQFWDAIDGWVIPTPNFAVTLVAQA